MLSVFRCCSYFLSINSQGISSVLARCHIDKVEGVTRDKNRENVMIRILVPCIRDIESDSQNGTQYFLLNSHLKNPCDSI